MLKARAVSDDGRPMLILGLSRLNTERLLEGKPIQILTSDYGIPGGLVIVIMGGETEASMQAELASHLTLPKAEPDPAPEREVCPNCLYGKQCDHHKESLS